MNNPHARESQATPGLILCGVPKAYRDMADIGSTAYCCNPAKTERGYCLRHDPVLGPQRDKQGRIVKRSQEAKWWQGKGVITIVAVLPSGTERRVTVERGTTEETQQLFDHLVAQTTQEA